MEIDVPKIDQFWEDQMVNAHGHSHGGSSGHLQYERNLNFATVAVEENEYGYPKKKTVRDPLSHRIIEKRRRDRMNNCLADLARLLPAASLRKGRGRIEKTEIVELAIKHLKHLQTHPCPQSDACEFTQMARNQKSQSKASASPSSSVSLLSVSSESFQSTAEDNFRLGYQECLSEAMHFLVETEGMYAGDTTCVRLVKHLNNHCENHMEDNGKLSLGFPISSRKMIETDNFKKSGSPSLGSGYQANGSSSGSDANGGNDGEGSMGNEAFSLPPASRSQDCNGTDRPTTSFDYEGDNNSCSSNPLSIEISDALSSDGKNTNRSSAKPPIPAIIYSGNSSTNSRSPAVLSSSNGRSADEGGSLNSAHRYKFKNNINKRFNEDLQIKHDTEDLCPTHENHDFAEEGEQNGEDRTKIEIDNANMTTSSNSSNDSAESPNCNDVTIIENGAAGEITEATVSGKSTPCPAVTLTACKEEKEIGDDYDKKLAPEKLLVPANPRNALNSVILEKKTYTIPLINAAAAALMTREEVSHIPLSVDSGCETTGVPAFALHDKGLYYIPLTIDKSIVSPFITAMEPNTQPPLHPVTISVSFLLSAQEAQNKLKDAPCSDKITLPVPMPISIPLPVTIANFEPVNSLLKTPKGIRKDQTNFIMNRFTQSQQFNPKMYGDGTSGYRYPIAMNGSGGSISSGSYSPVNNLITYPVLYGTSPPGSAINFGHSSQGSMSSYQSSSHHNYYNNSSSSGSNCSGGNNSDRDSSGKALRSNNINPGMGHEGNKTGSAGNSTGGSSNSSVNGSAGSNGHGHTSTRSSRTSGISISSRSQSRKRSISSSPSVSGSALSSSTGYHSWYEKTPSACSGDGIYSHGISMTLTEPQGNNSYTENLGHNYGHLGASHLHPHSHGHSHEHSHIHPQYNHGHSHNLGLGANHHNHYDSKEQAERTKGRSSPIKRVKKARITLDQDIQHKHNITVQGGGSIHR